MGILSTKFTHLLSNALEKREQLTSAQWKKKECISGIEKHDDVKYFNLTTDSSTDNSVTEQKRIKKECGYRLGVWKCCKWGE